MQGKKVTNLKAGTAYRFVISDCADIHDFHLSGPGFNRVLTSVEFTGTKSFGLKLKKGSYRFGCDPHSLLGSLFEFDYVWELFLPPAKRRWGW